MWSYYDISNNVVIHVHVYICLCTWVCVLECEDWLFLGCMACWFVHLYSSQRDPKFDPRHVSSLSLFHSILACDSPTSIMWSCCFSCTPSAGRVRRSGQEVSLTLWDTVHPLLPVQSSTEHKDRTLGDRHGQTTGNDHANKDWNDMWPPALSSSETAAPASASS